MNDIENMLIKKCKNNDVEAFESLISSHQKKVLNICYRYFPNYDDAVDLSQEIFIKIFKNISSFKGDSAVSTWIYRISVTTCIDELRRRKNKIHVSIDSSEYEDSKPIEIIDGNSNPDSTYEKKELKAQIQRAIDNMPEDFRMPVILRDIQNFSYEEISKILCIPLGTVKSRIKRGREYIKQYLTNKGNFFEKVSSK